MYDIIFEIVIKRNELLDCDVLGFPSKSKG